MKRTGRASLMAAVAASILALSLGPAALRASPIVLQSATSYGGAACAYAGACSYFTQAEVKIGWGVNNATPVYFFDQLFDLDNLPASSLRGSVTPADASFAPLVAVMDSPYADFYTTLQVWYQLSDPSLGTSSGWGTAGGFEGIGLLRFAYPSYNASPYTITALDYNLSLSGNGGDNYKIYASGQYSLLGYAGPPVSPVPEPPAFVLLFTGVLACALWDLRGRRRSRIAAVAVPRTQP